MNCVKAFVGSLLLLAIVSQTALAQTTPTKAKASNSKQSHEPLSAIVEKHFARWDRDHNSVLDLVEVDHVIEDRSVHGRLAALVVSLRYHMTKKDHQPNLSHQQLLKLVDEHDFVKTVDQTLKKLNTIDRELFLPTDPNLATFHQGRLNDCYLLSAIAAEANRNPKSIREMIHPEVTGGFKVHFGDGQKIHVEPLTDSELLLGAKLDDRHGSWLAVLEKAYGMIRKHEKIKKGDKADIAGATVPTSTLNWGNSAVIIALLTGHHVENLKLASSVHLDHVHNPLAEATKKKRLVCAGTNSEKRPPGIVNHHAYAVLGYDVQEKKVHVFNPWGNNFTPKGNTGIDHGYETKNGHFKIPLDQFSSVFSHMEYETEKKLGK